ncbi:MAG: alpha-D-glucose phosphate-specific phosphoglucomutase [Gammaproteobacteria bacterium]|nr:alpha-D-glucose phosphate-specific phosphoglucomutase [Gammaproteobacteria bacterium]
MPTREVATKPYPDQRPGTAGLRKKVAVFQQPHYLENFLQSIFDCHPSLRGASLVIGGDGRYHNRDAIGTAVAMAVANGVAKVIIGQGGLLTTPAASHLIRLRGAAGGLIFTASHNPAGPEGDFGVKFNVAGGGQADVALTGKIHAHSRELARYRICDGLEIDLDRRGTQQVEGLEIEVVDCVEDYAQLMQKLFDFERIRDWIKRGGRLRFDALHAATGPYARRILVEMLGAPAASVVGGVPLEDFGGGQPDPNLIHAKPLVEAMMGAEAPDFAAASDGDGDRNLILGRGLFVSPGDSLAMLTAHLDRLPGYRGRVHGVARSMPTSRAADAVAAALGIECQQTPTGWKFFCNLLDAGRVTICGEESFGTGSDHVREKDGLWAVLAWLNVLAVTGKPLAALAAGHWHRFGRHYFQRHDYENLSAAVAAQVTSALRAQLPDLPRREFSGLQVTHAEDFAYVDPIDGSQIEHQGLVVTFGEAARIVLRTSGTGTEGATLRLYLERCEPRDGALERPAAEALAPLAAIAEQITRIGELTGRKNPNVAT